MIEQDETGDQDSRALCKKLAEMHLQRMKAMDPAQFRIEKWQSDQWPAFDDFKCCVCRGLFRPPNRGPQLYHGSAASRHNLVCLHCGLKANVPLAWFALGYRQFHGIKGSDGLVE